MAGARGLGDAGSLGNVMKIKLFAALAAFSVVAMAGAASAATTPGPIVVALPDVANQLYTTNVGSILLDFDGVQNTHVTYSGTTQNGTTISNVATGTNSDINGSAPPPYDGGDGSPAPVTVCCQSSAPYLADPTNYLSVQANKTATFSTTGGFYLTAFSFYLGSPDTYNTLTFNFVGGGSQEFDGTDVWNGPDFVGDRTKGFRVYYDFNGAKVSSIVLGSVGSDAFESDGFAGTLGVPEPASWALMIVGFGAAGAMMRHKRRAAVAA